ncbi:Eukaryotic translation initiation factor 4E binding protein (EIF4EBP), partial [Blomia tropicalis]
KSKNKMATKGSGAKPIPTFRRVTINDASEMPDRYSQTPGGTLFSTTPGGTRIIYEKQFLMNLRHSPLAKSPPKMAFIPGVTNIPNDKIKGSPVKQTKEGFPNNNNNNEIDQFEMEI